MAVKLNIDVEKIKRLRIERGWTQEHLAEAADVSYRTIQRIEATGKTGMESMRALANAFGIDFRELLHPAPNAAEAPKPKDQTDSPRFLVRIKSGADLFAIVGGAHAGSIENEELENADEVGMIGTFLQEMSDWGEMWSELQPSERVQQTFEFTQKLKELDGAGFAVFGVREQKAVRVADKVIPDWNVAIIRVVRSTSPAINRVIPEGCNLGLRAGRRGVSTATQPNPPRSYR